ncbi:ribonuclease R [Sulfurirhabdus autotrophica]|uniref:Ribonuclease R n=1 Tax=Sulfurirhabdus autotrophica TaxID=1706046 RepID=A0A4R3Y9Q6_9PROT|nr:ribonuclease R [Sulfurirhabdus autotrophica]TCV87384.1 ribonuclease R [Sulfurirhabdus autotrophica]
MKKKKIRLQDPHLERERAQYEHPLPSREFILQILSEQGMPVSSENLAELLEIDDEEMDFFSRRLRAMEREGQIMRNRKNAVCVMDKLDLIKGKVQGHPDGFGFLIPEDGSPDLFLGPKEMHRVFHGDIVMAREIGLDRRGRREGSIVEVLQHVNSRLVGRLVVEHGVQFVVSENRRITQDILIAQGADLGAAAGQVVMVEIIEQPSKHAKPVARVVEILGNYADPGMEIEIALRKHELPHIFSAAVEAQAKKLPKKVLKKDMVGREDIRHLPLVTIDGETARDFDDAVYCEPVGKGYKLYVAIADVSHYVKPGEPLDVEGLERGNSVYFPRRVIPMLPEELSNGLCSLNPEVERLCMVCEMDTNNKGDIKSYRFYPAVMFSHARLTYNKVWAMLENPKGEEATEYKSVLPHVKNLYALFKTLLKARWARGAIDFETTETQMIFNDQGKIDRIVPVKRNDAHRLIEECMLAANVCASDFLQGYEHPTLYRVHQGPTPEKLQALHEFLREFGLSLGGGEEPHAMDYANLLDKIKDRPDAQLLQTVMLRSLQQAVYSPDNVGHFGLAYESYTHFTSPIRRYPDLLVHRSIKAVLNSEKYNPGSWVKLGEHCSTTERRADEATRDVESWLKCFYMQDKINETFDGTISGVTGFGIFVALDGIYVEGMVHVSELGSDYFHFDKAKHQMLGERTGKRYRLGDRVRAKVVRVDLETSKMDFVLEWDGDETLVSEEPLSKSKRSKGASQDEKVVKEKSSVSSKKSKSEKEAKSPRKPRTRTKK